MLAPLPHQSDCSVVIRVTVPCTCAAQVTGVGTGSERGKLTLDVQVKILRRRIGPLSRSSIPLLSRRPPHRQALAPLHALDTADSAAPERSWRGGRLLRPAGSDGGAR